MKVFAFVITTLLVILYPVGIGVGLSTFGARTVGLWILLVLVPVTLVRFRKARR